MIEWQDQKFLKVLPGRFAISRERAIKYSKALFEWILIDPVNYASVGETLLVGNRLI